MGTNGGLMDLSKKIAEEEKTLEAKILDMVNGGHNAIRVRGKKNRSKK